MHVHGRAGKPKQLARNAKNPGKTRVLQRRGQEPNFWLFFQWFWEVREVLFGDWNIAKNPNGGRFAWTNSLRAQMCLFRCGPTHDPQT
jgi:hypothetical protein